MDKEPGGLQSTGSQSLTQLCEAIILQLKINSLIFKNERVLALLHLSLGIIPTFDP